LPGTDEETGKVPTITMEELKTLLAHAEADEVEDGMADLLGAASIADELIRTKPKPVSEISADLFGTRP
jgi:hypothetical protein